MTLTDCRNRGLRLYAMCTSTTSVRRLLFLLLALCFSPVASAQAAGEEDRWARTIARVAESVVSLQLSFLRDFDDSEQGGSHATGFIVDAERGIILTNRHVMGSGPIRLSATFQNQERVDAMPLYRDPVHDFGFIRYDPSALRYSQPQSLLLRPDKVRTGMNIRVIGSDGGEQLSILPGTIARLDREVPSYGRYGYNDFNTFYLQAASGTSGGSSGSPVIDIDGHVVALNAAANSRTASSFFLPLPRVVHALEKLRAGEVVSRGGLQTLFLHKPFRELRRLGLDEESEVQARASQASTTGMLTVAQVIPGGVADGVLEAGDILLAVDGDAITDFVNLEAKLDAAIGDRLSIDVLRQGQHLQQSLPVANLHALAPDRFVELGDTVLQNLSIQHARAMNTEQRGVVVVSPGYFMRSASVPADAVIIAVDNQPVNDLDDLLNALAAGRDAVTHRIRYIVPGREFSSELAQIEMDGRWFGSRECRRRDDVRFWDCRSLDILPTNLQRVSTAPQTVPGDSSAPDDFIDVPQFEDTLLDRVAPAIVRVDFDIPHPTDNVYARHFNAVGIVVDKARGLVAVDRNTVPIGLGDARLIFFGAHEVPARVVFLHPRHNVALLQYDASRLADADYQALTLAADDGISPASLTMVGLRNDGTFVRHAINALPRLTINFPPPRLPRFQQSALDVYDVPNVPPSLGGPLVNDQGEMQAMYMSFAFEDNREIHQREWAMPAHVIRESLRLFREGAPYRSLDVRLSYQPLSTARRYGLPNDWLYRFNRLPAESRRVLHVDQVVPGTDANNKLLTGDMILAIDGELVSDLFTAERLSQREELELTILRDAQVRLVSLLPSALDTLGTQRVVSWAGALFQAPFTDIAWQKAVDFGGVYIAETQEGSPAQWDRLFRNRFVIAVDGEKISHLDDLINQLGERRQDQVTRLTLVSMSGRRQIVAVQPEYNNWPTFELRREDDGWRRIEHTH